MNNFDVLKEMSIRNMKIKMFPRDNVTQVWDGKKGGTIQMKVDPETAQLLMTDQPMIFGLLVADAEQFNALKIELEAGITS